MRECALFFIYTRGKTVGFPQTVQSSVRLYVKCDSALSRSRLCALLDLTFVEARHLHLLVHLKPLPPTSNEKRPQPLCAARAELFWFMLRRCGGQEHTHTHANTGDYHTRST